MSIIFSASRLAEDVLSAWRPPAWDTDALAVWATHVLDCERRLYYSLTGAPVSFTPDPELQMRFDAGKAYEALWVERFKRARMFVDQQVRIRDRRLMLSGAIDIVIDIGGELVPVEIKSANSRTFYTKYDYLCPECGIEVKAWNSVSCPDGHKWEGKPTREIRHMGFEHCPPDDMLAQVMVYVFTSRFDHEGQQQFQRGILLIEEKSFHNVAVWEIPRVGNEDRWDEIESRLLRVQEHVTAGFPPPRPFKADVDADGRIRNDVPCAKCDRAGECLGAIIRLEAVEEEERRFNILRAYDEAVAKERT